MKYPMRKWAAVASVTAVSFIITAAGAIGFMHTPMGKSLSVSRKVLALLGMQCPLDRNLTAEAVEASRLRGMAALRGKKSARTRPALGLALDSTNEAQALVWATTSGLSCESLVRGARFLKCKEPGTESVTTLAFNPGGRLVAVDVFRKRVSTCGADSMMSSVVEKLKAQLGKPHEELGEMSSHALVGGSLIRTAYVEYRFSDYLAKVTASYLPWAGLMFHEQYSSAKGVPQ